MELVKTKRFPMQTLFWVFLALGGFSLLSCGSSESDNSKVSEVSENGLGESFPDPGRYELYSQAFDAGRENYMLDTYSGRVWNARYDTTAFYTARQWKELRVQPIPRNLPPDVEYLVPGRFSMIVGGTPTDIYLFDSEYGEIYHLFVDNLKNFYFQRAEIENLNDSLRNVIVLKNQ